MLQVYLYKLFVQLLTCIYPRGSENIRKESEWFIDISNDRRFQFSAKFTLYTLNLACKGQGWRPLIAVFQRGAWKICPPRRKRTWQCSSALLLQVLACLYVLQSSIFQLQGKHQISTPICGVVFYSLSSFACHMI